MYLIPKNVKVRFEYFPGFGNLQLIVTTIGLGIGFLFFWLFGFITESFFRVILIAFFGAMGFFISVSHPKTGRNLMDFIKDSRKFKSGVRRYTYIHGEGRKYENAFYEKYRKKGGSRI